MISKSDWKEVHENLLDEQRRSLGEPPTPEELDAYSRGALPAEEEERVRALLVCYPELARTLIDLPEPEAPRIGDDDFLSHGELMKDWQSLQQRISGKAPKPAGRVLQMWGWPAAALLTLVFGGLLWRARSEIAEPRVVVAEHFLAPDGRRGAIDEPAVIPVIGDDAVFALMFRYEEDYERYRLEIRREAVNPGRRLWSSPVFSRTDNDTFPVLIPGRFLKPGDYDLVLYGVDGKREERLATYSVRVPRGRAATPEAPPHQGSR